MYDAWWPKICRLSRCQTNSSCQVLPSCAPGGAAAGVNALSPVTAQVLAATAHQQSHRKSRLQHVTMADTAASPSGLPQASPSIVAAPVAGPHQEGSRHTPQGAASAVRARACTPHTARGCAYMTPPTGSAQQPAVSHP